MPDVDAAPAPVAWPPDNGCPVVPDPCLIVLPPTGPSSYAQATALLDAVLADGDARVMVVNGQGADISAGVNLAVRFARADPVRRVVWAPQPAVVPTGPAYRLFLTRGAIAAHFFGPARTVGGEIRVLDGQCHFGINQGFAQAGRT